MKTLTANCETNLAFDGKLPFWKINDIKINEIEEIECFDTSKCGDIPVVDVLTNDHDGVSNNVGDSFNLRCGLGRKGWCKSIVHLI